MYGVFIKMAFLVFKKCELPLMFCKLPAKTQLFEISLKIHLTKWENAFEKLNYISVVTWVVTENPNFRVFVISLALKKLSD